MMGPEVCCGWLPRYLGPHPSLAGVMIGRHFPTRWEEYAFAVESLDPLPRGVVIDAGTGFNPEIHNLPYILGNLGWTVWAIDHDPRTMEMPSHPQVVRQVGDLTKLPYPDASVDAYVSISTLEHLTELDRSSAISEAHRVLKPGGWLVLTADWVAPLELGAVARCHDFDFVEEIPFHGERLDPHVAFLRTRKP